MIVCISSIILLAVSSAHREPAIAFDALDLHSLRGSRRSSKCPISVDRPTVGTGPASLCTMSGRGGFRTRGSQMARPNLSGRESARPLGSRQFPFCCHERSPALKCSDPGSERSPRQYRTAVERRGRSDLAPSHAATTRRASAVQSRPASGYAHVTGVSQKSFCRSGIPNSSVMGENVDEHAIAEQSSDVPGEWSARSEFHAA